MIRTIITPENRDIHISIPEAYVGKKVEVLLYTTDEPIDVVPEKKKTMAQFWGVISKESAEDLQQHVSQSRNEWERDI